ncbi:hypothetical protein N7495_006923 [Penicillium taxi]|uniref:uncharacterized protein n=1 Tax=Penicillium taxi TaxID=168475 RepID=UPI0025456A42|nr:uncharacterized protein N7495_006923 [Penicillium taxi]KAJ5895232.1 hypothetical protein N7495_006923 [Penicillium taxi]
MSCSYQFPDLLLARAQGMLSEEKRQALNQKGKTKQWGKDDTLDQREEAYFLQFPVKALLSDKIG